MEHISNRILEPLFNDLSSSLDLRKFASSNEMIRFLTKIQAYERFYEFCEGLRKENRMFYAGVDADLKEKAFLILLDVIYSNNSSKEFCEFLVNLFQEYEEWSNKKLFMKNIIKDLELLPEFTENKIMFDGIGYYERESVTNTIAETKKETKPTQDTDEDFSGHSELDFTMNRQVLAIYYLLNGVDKKVFSRNKSEIARFMQFLTGKSYDNIYKKVLNPLPDQEDKLASSHNDDVQFVKEQFRKLGLDSIARMIENDHLIG